MLNRFKGLLLSFGATVIAFLLFVIAHLRASHAKLDKELRRRELQHLKAQAEALRRRSEKTAAAQTQSQLQRQSIERKIKHGQRDYFENE